MMSFDRQQHLLSIIKGPRMSEKATRAADEHGQIVFEVPRHATKPDIKAAVEWLYGVNVVAVQVCPIPGKRKQFARRPGYQRPRKKAYVCLAPGQDIDFTSQLQSQAADEGAIA